MKNVRLIRKDERAVSPVIATILMVAITVVLAAVLYVMVSGLIAGPGGGPQTIGVSQTSGASNWQLQISSVPATHSLTTTTALIRWANNATIVNPPGQISLDAIKTTAVNGVQYVRVDATATQMKVLDVLTITKSGVYISGMQVTIADGSTILWQGTLA